MAEPEPVRPTRFAPTVVLGVASAVLAVVASTHAWAVSHPEQGDHMWMLARGAPEDRCRWRPRWPWWCWPRGAPCW